VIYRNSADGTIYRYSPTDGKKEVLCKNAGAMCVYGDTLYFNSSSVGICSVSISDGESSCKEILVESSGQKLPVRYDIEMSDDGKIYFPELLTAVFIL